MLAYRLAHKYLSKTGTIVLSCHQSPFLKYKEQKKNKTQAEQLFGSLPESSTNQILIRLVGSQVSYLGLVIGDREYTHLHSNSIIALATGLW